MPLHGITEGKCDCGKSDCGSPGKHPRTRRGRNDATTDEDIIRGWWTVWETANVGIGTGPESGFFMVGPDGQPGIDALAELERKHGSLPPTPWLRSGGGGRHYYFRLPSEGGIKSGANIHGLPIDVRGSGGLVVAPPSRHVSGNCYAWEVGPDVVEVAPAPGWLLDWLLSGKGTNRKKGAKRTIHSPPPPSTGIHPFHSLVREGSPTNGRVVFTVQPDQSTDIQSRAVAYLGRCPPAISGQGGHNQTFEVARAIVYGFNLGPDIGYNLLSQHYNPRCLPPWSVDDLKRKCNEADTRPYDKPRGYLLGEGNQIHPTVNSTSPLGSNAEDIETLPMPQPPPWPPLQPEALHGLPGEIVQTLAPETESDPVAILGQILVAFGNAVGRGPHYMVEGNAHYTNLYETLVGESSRGRKGTSRGRVMQLMKYADEGWCQNCIATGLSSGEGLIWAVRDPIEEREPIREKGRVTEYQSVVRDQGVPDKRLFADESEFAQVLKVMQRDGNSLSPVIRQGWDTGNLRILTKNNPAKATGAHISISAHITIPELIKLLKSTEALNGFANRFIWLCVRRSQLLPDGGRALDLAPLGNRLNIALATARNIGAMTRDSEARRLWHDMYPQLTAERPGVYGAVTGRAEAQVLRLSMVYALLDSKSIIEADHLRAALALWSYADASARLIFGAEPEDPLISLVLAKLQEAGSAGLTRTDLHNAFCRNIPAANLIEALAKLRDRGGAYPEKVKTGKPGAPAERWFPRRKNENNESIPPAEPRPAADAIDSLYSLLRCHSSDTTVSGGEVVG